MCEYQPGIPKGKSKKGLPRLDIASAGSGFHQVLLLLAFFYARPASVLLLDEPDAHLHVILQKNIYDRLRKVAAERSCQLVIATHSEVLIDGTSPDQILSFLGIPHRLLSKTDRDQPTEALKRVTAMDILLVESSAGILYVQGETDFNLLRAWARVLNRGLLKWLTERPFWQANQGRNPRGAREHFFALRAIRTDIRGVLLLDGDNRGLPDHEVAGEGLVVLRWKRYEAESNLLHPEALLRYVEGRSGQLFTEPARTYLDDQLPRAVIRNPLADHDYLASTRASKTLLPGFFDVAGLDLSKNEYYLVAEEMRPEEPPAEIEEKLNQIGAVLLAKLPA